MLTKNRLLGMVKSGCDQSGHRTLKLTVSQMNKWNEKVFLPAGKNSGKLKVDSMIFGWVLSKLTMVF